MEKFNKARKLFGSLDFSSDSSNNSVIYISSDEETSEGWDSDWSTDTEELVRRVETQVQARPIPIAGRKLTTASDEPGPSTVSPNMQTTPKLDKEYFDEKLCYAPTRGNTKWRIELCKTILPVLESPLSPLPTRRGRQWTRRYYSLKTVDFTPLSIFRMRFLTRTSVPRGVRVVWSVESQ